MSLYNDIDEDELLIYLNDINNKISEIKAIQLEPYISDQIKVHKIIMEYIKQNKRKMYGGFAINMLIKDKDENDGFYKYFPITSSTDITKITTVPDIDFYSPDPIKDIIEICNLLQDNNFIRVEGKEAQHDGSYTIFVDFIKFCDISYVPLYIYNNIPFINIYGYIICRNDWIMIDYLRMFSDPMLSYHRLSDDLKSLKRFNLLMKYYPFFDCKNLITLETPTADTKLSLDVIYNYLLNKQSIIVVGYYAFNVFLYYSKMIKNNDNKNNNITYLPIPCYEFVSINYKNDVLDLLKLLSKFNVTYKEFYSFVDYIGYSIKIYHNNMVIAIIYDNNERCLPYFDYEALHPYKLTLDKQHFIRIGSFHIVLLYAIIMYIYARTYKKSHNTKTVKCEIKPDNMREYNDENTENVFKILSYQLLIIRNYYFNTYKKNFMDDTIFKDFTYYCIGYTIEPSRKQRLLYESRHKNKERIQFKYNPSNSNDRENIKKLVYKYPNISGNIINNPKNLKINPIISSTNEQEDNNE